MWMIERRRADSVFSGCSGMGCSFLFSHDAVLWIFDVLDGELSGDVMKRVRNLISSNISAAVVLRFKVSRVSSNVVGDGRSGHFNASAYEAGIGGSMSRLGFRSCIERSRSKQQANS
jgi:hypothetical protein